MKLDSNIILDAIKADHWFAAS